MHIAFIIALVFREALQDAMQRQQQEPSHKRALDKVSRGFAKWYEQSTFTLDHLEHWIHHLFSFGITPLIKTSRAMYLNWTLRIEVMDWNALQANPRPSPQCSPALRVYTFWILPTSC